MKFLRCGTQKGFCDTGELEGEVEDGDLERQGSTITGEYRPGVDLTIFVNTENNPAEYKFHPASDKKGDLKFRGTSTKEGIVTENIPAELTRRSS